MKKLKSIKTKILLVVCLLVVLSLLVVGSTVSFLMYRSSLQSLELTMGETASVAANLVVEYLETYKAVATEAGLVARLSNPDLSIAEKKAVVDAKVQQYGFVGGSITDTEGNNLFSDSNVADRDYFKAAIQGETVVSDIIFSRSANCYTINAAAPIWEGGKTGTTIVGVVFFNIDANNLSNITNEIRVGETGSAYMLDKENYTIAHKTIRIEDRDNTKLALTETPDLQPLADIEARMTAGEMGFGTYRYHGASKLLAYAPVPNGNGWSLAVTAELGEFIESTYNAIILTVIFIVIAIVIGVLISISLANSIARPIREIENAAHALSQGRLDSDITFQSRDELGNLAESMRNSMRTLKTYIFDIDKAMGDMANGNFDISDPTEPFVGEFASIEQSMHTLSVQMSDTLSQIMTASDQVSSGAEQVSCGAQALSQGATEQAASIQELSATIGEISQQIQVSADNAGIARGNTEQTATDVRESNSRMQEMIAAMHEINSKSTEIGKIIKTIEDIAFQTNILALNAAVEAARAGAAGKGFAVVADEVRNLAGKSAEAAANTTALIEETVKAVDNGARIADVTASAMQSVVGGAANVTSLINEIADATGEQATAVTQVMIGVEQISGVVQQNSATAEESAAASEELSGQATMLKGLVSRFHLRSRTDSRQSAEDSKQKNTMR